jgi:mRNA deadenylase 3'-5' endonuclease subunit Ccr4
MHQQNDSEKPKKTHRSHYVLCTRLMSEKGPLFRDWVQVGSEPAPPHISVLSYNVLAESYCKPAYFPYANPAVKVFPYRFPRIAAELRHYRADIITLQVSVF